MTWEALYLIRIKLTSAHLLLVILFFPPPSDFPGEAHALRIHILTVVILWL